MIKPFTVFVDSFRILIFVFVQFLISVTNLILMRRPPRSSLPAEPLPRVSVLIPARNEEQNILLCVNSLLKQEYSDYEVLVLDDNSDDRTREILAAISAPRLKIITGKPLPPSWVGKNWACHQLAEQAQGKLLLFTDADTVFAPDALRRAVIYQQQHQLDLLTGIIRNRVETPGEQLTVPFIVWSVVSILPLGIAYWWRKSRAFAAANGKFLLFTRSAYQQIGGHQAVKGEAVEDLALARLIKGAALRWRLIDLTELVSTRMYQGFRSAWNGFTKNFFAIFDYRLLPALFVWCWLLLITFHPLLSLLLPNQPDFHHFYALLTIILQILIWILIVWRLQLPKLIVLYYPLTMLISSIIGLTSLVLTLTRKTEWKGRKLPAHRIKII